MSYNYFKRVCTIIPMIILGFLGNAQNFIDGFQVNKNSGLFQISDSNSGSPWFSDVSAAFKCNGEWFALKDLDSKSIKINSGHSTFGEAEMLTWILAHPSRKIEFALELISYPGNDWHTINAWVENKSKENITLNAIRLLETDQGIHSGESWEKWRVLNGRTDNLKWAGEALSDEESRIKAMTQMAMWNAETNQEVVMGYSIKHAWGGLELTKSNTGMNLSADVRLDIDLEPGEKGKGEALHIKAGPALESMHELIKVTGDEVDARSDGESFGGWCSWYGFNPFIDNDITEDVVVDFAKTAEEKKDVLPLQLMLLDDGYFTLPGDWTTVRPFFPNGMKYLAGEVSKRGIIPGIWIAISIAHENSEIIKIHPEWVDTLDNGAPRHHQINWGYKTHSFDISNPEVLHHVDSIFNIVCNEWGYKYLKLDFNVEPGPNRYDRSITSFEAIRNMYRVIRKAVGPDVFIANCAGSPYPPGIGIAQAGRVGPDVNPNWPSVIRGCERSLHHIPFHRRWWVNDPDCLNMRKIGSQLTDEEVQTHLTANFMGGGYVMFSDSLNKLPADRERMLAQALPSYGIAAAPVNYMKSPGIGIPNILNLPIEQYGEKYAVTSVFNWEEEAVDIELSLEELGLGSGIEYHVFDFWTDTYKGVFKEKIQITSLQPHACQQLAVKPVMPGEIQVVSTSLHLLQGTMEISDIKRMNTSPFTKARAEIWISLEPVSLRDGKLVLAAEDGLRIAAMQGGKASLVKRKDGLWDLNVSELQDKAAVLLRVR
ncbi:MAG: alpha-galactosidase [Bacteroidetes bacterium]|nr:alpha-galactosidase [Bacteroidota bacterium]